MPVLDTEMWLGKESREKGIPAEISRESEMKTNIGDLKTIILFNFYRKPYGKPMFKQERECPT